MKRKVFYAALLTVGVLMGLYYVFAAKTEGGVLLAVCICWFTAVFGLMFEINSFFSYYEGNYEEEYNKSLEEELSLKSRFTKLLEPRPERGDEELEQRQADMKLYVKFFLTSGIAAGVVLWLLRLVFLD